MFTIPLVAEPRHQLAGLRVSARPRCPSVVPKKDGRGEDVPEPGQYSTPRVDGFARPAARSARAPCLSRVSSANQRDCTAKAYRGCRPPRWGTPPRLRPASPRRSRGPPAPRRRAPFLPPRRGQLALNCACSRGCLHGQVIGPGSLQASRRCSPCQSASMSSAADFPGSPPYVGQSV